MKKEINQSHVIPLKSNPTIEIESNYVNVFVEASPDENVTFDLHLVSRGHDLDKCENIYEFSSNETDNKAWLQFNDDESCHLDSKESRILVKAPENSKLQVENENGRIHCKNVTATFSIETENGSIATINCKGTMNVQSENGAIKIHDMEGEINAETENGLIKLSGGKGEALNCETENGKIKIEKADYRTINLETENGRVICEVPVRSEGNTNIETENGSIDIVIPEELEFTADCSMEYGSFSNSVKAKVETISSDHDEKKFHIERGNGSYKIAIETENGSIRMIDSNTIGMDGVKVEVNRFKKKWKKLSDEEMNIEDKVQQALKDVDFDKISRVLEKKAAIISKRSVQKSIDAALKTVSSLQDKLCNLEIKISDDGDEPKVYTKKVFVKREKPEKPAKPAKPDCPDCPEVPDIPDLDEIEDTVSVVINDITDAVNKADTATKPVAKSNDKGQSRLKILDLLEKGVITSEQAERLLAAIK